MYPTQAKPVTQVQPVPIQTGAAATQSGTVTTTQTVVVPGQAPPIQTVLAQPQQTQQVGAKYKKSFKYVGVSN